MKTGKEKSGKNAGQRRKKGKRKNDLLLPQSKDDPLPWLRSENLWRSYPEPNSSRLKNTYTVCTRRSDPFYLVSYYINWVTFLTYST